MATYSRDRLTSVVLVDAVRTPFGKAGSLYAGTRADDLMVRAMRGLLERNPQLPLDQIDDVAIAAATQTGDQGMNLGRSSRNRRHIRHTDTSPGLPDRFRPQAGLVAHRLARQH